MNCRALKNRWGQMLILFGMVLTGMVSAQDREVEIGALGMREGIRYLASEEYPFNGTALTRYPDGNIALKAIFRNGVQHGLETGWYQSGRLKHEIMYRFGQPQTLGSKWYEDKPAKEPGIVLCSESERLAGYCDQNTVNEASGFEPCIDGEECDIVLCSESERLTGYCNEKAVDEASRFEPCIDGEECGEYESGSSFRSCAEGEC